MVDSQVLIYAMAYAVGFDDEQHGDKPWRSFSLVDTAETVTVSAITWFEVRRTTSESQAEILTRWQSRIEILPVDARVASRAAALIEAARAKGVVCPRCLGLKPPVTCSACGSQRSKQQRTHDTIIVAGAAVDPSIRTLYSFDGGVLKLGELVEDEVSVKEPPPVEEQLDLPATSIRDGNRPKPKARSKADKGR